MSAVSARTMTRLDRVLSASDLARRESLLHVVREIGGGTASTDVFTVVSETFANALLHGKADSLRLVARSREGLLLLVFHHEPALSDEALAAHARARSGWLPDRLEACGGLGLPLMYRLSRRITLSSDRARLRVWLSVEE